MYAVFGCVLRMRGGEMKEFALSARVRNAQTSLCGVLELCDHMGSYFARRDGWGRWIGVVNGCMLYLGVC